MEQLSVGKFRCASCGRDYPWKPDYAGRKVKCKCGSIMTAPTEPPPPPEPEQDDLMGGLYELAEDASTAARAGAVETTGLRCPSCQADMNVGDVVCSACGFNLKTGLKARAQKATAATAGAIPDGNGAAAAARPANSMLAYASMARKTPADARGELNNSIGGTPITELYIPGGLVVLGLVMQAMLWMHDGGAWRSFGAALPSIFIALIVNLVLCLIGVGMMAKMLELGLGSPGPAALKFVAICLLPPALAQFIGNFVGSDSMFVRIMVPCILMTPLTVASFILLFQLAYDEALYCTIAVWLVNQWAVPFIVAFVLAGGFGSRPAPNNAIVQADKDAAESLTWNTAHEADEFLADNGNRMFRGQTHDESLKMVKDLKDAGAKTLTVLKDEGEGTEMIVTLPSKSAPRAKVFAYIHQYETAHGKSPADLTPDEGQTYHTFYFHNIAPSLHSKW